MRDQIRKRIEAEIDALLALKQSIAKMQEMHDSRLEALAAKVTAEGETLSALLEARRTAA